MTTLGWSEKFGAFNTKAQGLGAPHAASLDGWRLAANQMLASGCEPQAFAMLASFGAPLMALFPTPEGGAVVSIHGGRKSGKSVAMAAAATVWGLPPAPGKHLPLDVHGKDRLANVAMLRHLPAITLEIARMDPAIAYGFIEQFLMPKEKKAWATILLCFGGQSVNAAMATLSNPASQTAPPITLEFGLHIPRGLIEPDKGKPSMLERRLLDHRGTAGKAFLEKLIHPKTVLWCKKMLASKYALMVDERQIGHEWRFHMRAIAAAWVAGILCADAGILEISPERIARWAMDAGLPARGVARALPGGVIA